MIVENAELSLKITKAACEKMRKESLESIENKFKDLLTNVAKMIHDAARGGKSSVKIISEYIPDEDWEDIKWYLEMNNYEVWKWSNEVASGFVVSWT